MKIDVLFPSTPAKPEHDAQRLLCLGYGFGCVVFFGCVVGLRIWVFRCFLQCVRVVVVCCGVVCSWVLFQGGLCGLVVLFGLHVWVAVWHGVLGGGLGHSLG